MSSIILNIGICPVRKPAIYGGIVYLREAALYNKVKKQYMILL